MTSVTSLLQDPRGSLKAEGLSPTSLKNHAKRVHLAGNLASTQGAVWKQCPATKTSFAMADLLLQAVSEMCVPSRPTPPHPRCLGWADGTHLPH